jgi:hypothetical protein
MLSKPPKVTFIILGSVGCATIISVILLPGNNVSLPAAVLIVIISTRFDIVAPLSKLRHIFPNPVRMWTMVEVVVAVN